VFDFGFGGFGPVVPVVSFRLFRVLVHALLIGTVSVLVLNQITSTPFM
jgi:hypothetical protein